MSELSPFVVTEVFCAIDHEQIGRTGPLSNSDVLGIVPTIDARTPIAARGSYDHKKNEVIEPPEIPGPCPRNLPLVELEGISDEEFENKCIGCEFREEHIV